MKSSEINSGSGKDDTGLNRATIGKALASLQHDIGLHCWCGSELRINGDQDFEVIHWEPTWQ